MQMKRSLKEITLRLVLLFTGLVIAHLGVTLFLLTELGADPFNVFVQGIFRTLRNFLGMLTHGYTHVSICIIIILLLLIIDKSYIKIGTVVCMVFGGPIIDFFTRILNTFIHAGNPFALRIATLAAGCVILAFGMTIVIKSDAGTGPNDLVAIVISDKQSKPFGQVRIIVDFCFVAIGFLLGGAVGIGTIISAFLVGPIAGVFLPYSEKIVNRVISAVIRKAE
jgi:Predicted membrane protein